MQRNDRLEWLAVMHSVYADNETIQVENRTLRFEPKEYHLGMAKLYRSWKQC